MKKGIKFYAPCWAIALALFNVITFVIPVTVNANKFTPSFWIGYAFITVMFIAQLVCSVIFFKQDNLDKLFLNIPVISLSYTALIVSILVGAVAMAVPQISYWVGIIVEVLVAGFYAIAIISSKATAEEIERIDTKIKTRTFFIKSLTVDAESLIARATNDEIKAETKKVYEAIRYSDPMSNDALAGIENQIQNEFNAFADAVKNNDTDLAKSTANDVVILINDRNKKCKLIK